MAKTRYLENLVNGVVYQTRIDAVNAGAIAIMRRQFKATCDTYDLLAVDYDKQELAQAMYEVARKNIVEIIRKLENKYNIPSVEIMKYANKAVGHIGIDIKRTNIKDLPFDEAVIKILSIQPKKILFKLLGDSENAGMEFHIGRPKSKKWDAINIGDEALVSVIPYGQEEQYRLLRIEYISDE